MSRRRNTILWGLEVTVGKFNHFCLSVYCIRLFVVERKLGDVPVAKRLRQRESVSHVTRIGTTVYTSPIPTEVEGQEGNRGRTPFGIVVPRVLTTGPVHGEVPLSLVTLR